MPVPMSKEKKIPFGRHSLHFAKIQNCLACALHEIRNIPGLSAKLLWVTCRLNKTRTEEPVFGGWVETNEAITIRVNRGFLYAPIDIRFGDTHPSHLYSECLRTPPGQMVLRNWLKQTASPGSQEIGRNFYGETHRRSVPINIDGRSVGTVNAAFVGDPVAEDNEIGRILFACAQDANSELVKYIKDNLEYSPGP